MTGVITVPEIAPVTLNSKVGGVFIGKGINVNLVSDEAQFEHEFQGRSVNIVIDHGSGEQGDGRRRRRKSDGNGARRQTIIVGGDHDGKPIELFAEVITEPKTARPIVSEREVTASNVNDESTSTRQISHNNTTFQEDFLESESASFLR